MAYVKTVWSTGDTITASLANHWETQYEEAVAEAQARFMVHADATSAHSATSAATANRIIMRDSAGRAKVAAPVASDDIARKAEVDANELLGSQVAVRFIQDIGRMQAVKVEKPLGLVSIPVMDVPPEAPGRQAAFSSDGTYLAVAMVSAPYLALYKRVGSSFTRLPAPTGLPSAAVRGLTFATNADYLVTTCDDPSVKFCIFKRSGDTFTKLPAPSTMPPEIAVCCHFDSTGTYLALGIQNSLNPTKLMCYTRSGDVFTSMSIGTQPNDSPLQVRWSHDSFNLATAGYGTPQQCAIYSRSGTSLTRRWTQTVDSDAYGVSWSPDDSYVAMIQGASPRIYMWRRVSTTSFAAVSDSFEPPNSWGYGLEFSPDGSILVAASRVEPYLVAYSHKNGLLTLEPNLLVPLDGQVRNAAFSPDGQMIAVPLESAPYFVMLGDTEPYAKPGLMDAEPNSVCLGYGYANEAGAANQVKSVTLLWKP